MLIETRRSTNDERKICKEWLDDRGLLILCIVMAEMGCSSIYKDILREYLETSSRDHDILVRCAMGSAIVVMSNHTLSRQSQDRLLHSNEGIAMSGHGRNDTLTAPGSIEHILTAVVWALRRSAYAHAELGRSILVNGGSGGNIEVPKTRPKAEHIEMLGVMDATQHTICALTIVISMQPIFCQFRW